jgi:ADP-heptose:LPS heptosyltransferase
VKLWISKKYEWSSKHAQKAIEDLSPEEIKSVAVIKHAALGDMVLARPFLITLRKAFPKAYIKFSVISHYQNGIPDDLIDSLHICFGKKERGKPIKEVIQNYRDLGDHDIVFDISCTARSLWITYLNKATLKVGFIPSGGHKYFYKWIYDIAVHRNAYILEAETFLMQLKMLGIYPELPLKFNLPKGERTIEDKYFLYFPTASDPYKCWPDKYFKKLISQMCENYPGYKHIILSGLQDWEKKIAKKIMQLLAAYDQIELILGDEKTFDIVSHADLLISNDTGIRNYAIAAEVPTVGIFFSTMPFSYIPHFSNHRGVFERDGSLPSVERVYQEVKELLTHLK